MCQMESKFNLKYIMRQGASILKGTYKINNKGVPYIEKSDQGEILKIFKNLKNNYWYIVNYNYDIFNCFKNFNEVLKFLKIENKKNVTL